jgi:hypothetical protein
MSIKELGSSLLQRAGDVQRDNNRSNRRRAKKDAVVNWGLTNLLELGKSVGKATVANKNEDFLNNIEDFHGNNATFKANVSEAESRVGVMNGARAGKGGVSQYFQDQATLDVVNLPGYAQAQKLYAGQKWKSYVNEQTFSLAKKYEVAATKNEKEALEFLGRIKATDKSQGYKNEMLKGRATNLKEMFTMPMVNFFSGRNEGNPQNIDEETEIAATSPTGSIGSGQVKESNMSILKESTSLDFTTRLEILKELNDSATHLFGRNTLAARNFASAPPVTGPPVDVKIIDANGDPQTVTAIPVTKGGVTSYTDIHGKSITGAVVNRDIDKVVAGLTDERVGQIQTSVLSLYTEDQRTEMGNYINAIVPKDPTDKQIAHAQKAIFGKMYVTARTLTSKFGIPSIQATQIAAEAHYFDVTENMFTKGKIYSPNVFSSYGSVLNNFDAMDTTKLGDDNLIIKAMNKVIGRDPDSPLVKFRDEITQYNAALQQERDEKIGTTPAPDVPITPVTKVAPAPVKPAAIVVPKEKEDNVTIDLTKLPRAPRRTTATADVLQRGAYNAVTKAYKALQRSQAASKGRNSRGVTVPTGAVERDRQKLNSLYSAYMNKYGE